jgi:hypothetical protein
VADPEVSRPAFAMRRRIADRAGGDQGDAGRIFHLRSSAPPATDPATGRVYTEFSRLLQLPHRGLRGRTAGASHAGLKLSAETIEQRIIDPKSGKQIRTCPRQRSRPRTSTRLWCASRRK